MNEHYATTNGVKHTSLQATVCNYVCDPTG